MPVTLDNMTVEVHKWEKETKVLTIPGVTCAPVWSLWSALGAQEAASGEGGEKISKGEKVAWKWNLQTK